MSATRDAYGAGLAGVGAAAAGSAALATGFQNALRHIGESAERRQIERVAAQWQAELDAEAKRAAYAEAALDEAEDEIDSLLEEVATLRARLGES